MQNCQEKVHCEDVGDGYSDWVKCGGEYRFVYNLLASALYQCSNCKTIKVEPLSGEAAQT